MVTFLISIKDGPRTSGRVLEFDDIGPEELARIEDAIHEIRDDIERITRTRAARAERNRT